MRVLLTGATGFVGRALVPALLGEGHQLVAWARSADRARSVLGAEVDVRSSADGEAALVAELGSCDAVVNLAGEPIIGRRWTEARKQQLVASRVAATERLVRACGSAARRPAVLISASAVGYYGDRGDAVLTEDAEPGRDFLGNLVERWEAAALGAEALGVRVVLLRTGIVLGRDGGALRLMLPPFQLGLGGPVGSGEQYLSWIHLRDVVGVVAAALTDPRYRGPVNVTGPEEATNRDFAHGLGTVLHRPAVLPAPAVAVGALLGEAATVLLSSQRAQPKRLQELGFRWGSPTLASALADVVRAPFATFEPLEAPPSSGSAASAEYLYRRPPRYELRTTMRIEAPLDRVFGFFSNVGNLGLITPMSMGLRLDGPPPTLKEDAVIKYQIRVGPVPVRWRARIVRWGPPKRFVEVQDEGPYFSWWHEHTFSAEGELTIMEDRVCYAPPVPAFLGDVVNRLIIVPMLRRAFAYREDAIRLRFGGAV